MRIGDLRTRKFATFGRTLSRSCFWHNGLRLLAMSVRLCSGIGGGGASVSAAGNSRITPFGAMLYFDKLSMNSWMCRGIRSTTLRNRADKLQGEDRKVLSFDLAQEPIRPSITGPASLKYRLEDEQIAAFVASVRSASSKTKTLKTPEGSVSNEASEIVSVLPSSASSSSTDSNAVLSDPSGKKQEINLSDDNPLNLSNLSNLPEGYEEMTDQELAVWYNDNVI